MNTTEKRERNDWTLLFFIIPIGIILILIVGELAIRLMPFWSVNADMKSNLEPNPDSPRPFALLQPLMPQLLTPMAWADNYLTPGAVISFPEFVTFEPTASPSSTPVPTTETQITPTGTPSATQSATPTTPPAPTGSPTKTPSGKLCEDVNALNYGQSLPCKYSSPPPTTCQDPAASNFGQPLPCQYPPTTCQDPAASNFGQPLPCQYPPTTCQDPAASNFGQPLPCQYPPTTCQDPAASNFGQPLPCQYPPTTCQDNTASNYGQALPCKYPVASTPPAGTPAPKDPDLGVGTLPDNTSTTDYSLVGSILDGTYVVVNLAVTVSSTPDKNYDLVFYEFNNGGTVNLDWIIIGISNSATGSSYYEVFNWGDGKADTNSNVGDVAGSENDDQAVPLTELYDPDGSSGPAPQTGILIDVDTAPSNPQPGVYNYVVIISPSGGTGGSAQVDAIQTVEEPIPTPTPTP